MRISLFALLVMLVIVMFYSSEVEALSCRAGRGACMASCMVQNCATGYCPQGTEGICVCSRCGIGPINPRPRG